MFAPEFVPSVCSLIGNGGTGNWHRCGSWWRVHVRLGVDVRWCGKVVDGGTRVGDHLVEGLFEPEFDPIARGTVGLVGRPGNGCRCNDWWSFNQCSGIGGE